MDVQCYKCGGGDLVKRGKHKKSGASRLSCKECGHIFYLRTTGDTVHHGASPRKFSIETKGVETNECTVTVKGSSRKKDDALKSSGVDLGKWVEEGYSYNEWTTPVRANPKAPPEPFVNTQHKFRFKRRQLDPVEFAPIAPILIQGRRYSLELRKTPRGDLRTTLIFGDTHFGFKRETDGSLTPFHDRRALDLALQAAAVLRPDKIVHLGDLLDLPEHSTKFSVSPDHARTTQAAMVEAAAFMSALRLASTNSEMVLLFGNHDERWDRYNREVNAAAYGVRPVDALGGAPYHSLKAMLGLEKQGIAVCERYPAAHWHREHICIEHGDRVGRGGAALDKYFNEIRCTIIIGHIHESVQKSRTFSDANGQRTIYGYSPGTLAHIDGRLPSTRRRAENWQQGFGVLTEEATGTRHNIEHAGIMGGWATLRGKSYTGDEGRYCEYLRSVLEGNAPALALLGPSFKRGRAA